MNVTACRGVFPVNMMVAPLLKEFSALQYVVVTIDPMLNQMNPDPNNLLLLYPLLAYFPHFGK
jgi:hypothetical protein